MKRTQIYLLDRQKEALNKMARQKNKALAEIIREAIDSYLAEHELSSKDRVMEAAGLWKGRSDLDSAEFVQKMRRELNKRLEELSE